MAILEHIRERPFISTLTTRGQLPMFRQVWGVVRHELMYISWALMEIALLVPLVLGLMGWARFWPPQYLLIWAFIFYLLPLNFIRFMSALTIKRSKQQLILLGLAPILIVCSTGMMAHQRFSPFDLSWISEFIDNLQAARNVLWARDVVIMLITAVVWNRGITLMHRNFTIASTGLFLRLGGLIVAPLVVWVANGRLAWNITPYLLLFFGAGMLSIALVRAEELEQRRSGQSAYLTPRWVGHIILTCLLILFVAGTIAVILSGETSSILGLFAPIWNAASFLATIVGLTLLLLFLPIIDAITQFATTAALWLQDTFQFATTPQVDPNSSADDWNIIGLNFSEVATWFNTVGKIIIFAIVGFIIFLFAVTLVRTFYLAIATRNSQSLDAPKQPSLFEGTLWDKLKEQFGFLQDWRTAKTIRKVYERMTQLADSEGFPRSEAETPYEYINTLSHLWPDRQAEIQLITTAYVNIRYGELPESVEEFEAIVQAWQVLEQTAVQKISTKSNE